MKFLLIAAVTPLVLAACRPAERAGGQRPAPANLAGERGPQAKEPLAVEASVTRVVPRAAWHHYSDGAFEAFDAITFSIAQPQAVRGRELTVYYSPDALPHESPLRTIGTRCRFRIAAEHLEPPAAGESREIHAGALEELTVLGESSE